MTLYRYTALDALGKRRRGTAQASSEAVLEKQLRTQGLDLLTVRPAAPAWYIGLPRRAPGQNAVPKHKMQVLNLFCLQLAQLSQAGVPILQALSELATAEVVPATAQVLHTLHNEVESGKLLSQAMQAQTAMFPPWVVHLIAAAEYSGRLPEILEQIAQTLQWQMQMRAQLLQGLLYPCLLALVVLAAAIAMLTVLVPQMASFLQSMGQTLPWTTRLLLGLSEWVKTDALWVIALLAVIGLFTRHWLRTSSQRLMQWQRWCCACPLVGKLLQRWLLGTLCRMLALLYQSGVPLMQALTLCQPMLPLALARAALQQVEQHLQAGHTLADSFARSDWFPPLFIRMVRTGEQSGGLDRSLWQLGDWYMREVQTQLQWMLRMLEPLLTVVLGLMLLFLMAAVILPVYDSFNSYAH